MDCWLANCAILLACDDLLCVCLRYDLSLLILSLAARLQRKIAANLFYGIKFAIIGITVEVM